MTPISSDARLRRAFELLSADGISVLSLDVFDTMVWRTVAEPTDAFPLLGERLRSRGQLVDHVTPALFARLRELAELRARSWKGGAEVTLREIYAGIPDFVFAHNATSEVAAQAEITLERELLMPDLDVVTLVEYARERGKTVVGVSDTYYSEEELATFVSPGYSGASAVDRFFASSNHGRGKAGGLFEVVLAELDRKPREVVHVGDNPDADIRGAKKAGIRPVEFERRPKELQRIVERESHYVAPAVPNWEQLPLRPWQRDFGLTSLRGKVLHRGELEALPEDLRPFWSYGAVSIGPALTGFAEWIVERARRRQVQRVFCFMREGEILSQLINTASAYSGSELVAEPFWLSRQVCARAAIFDGSRDELASLLVRRRAPTVRELCRGLQLEPERLERFRSQLDLSLSDPALADEVLDELSRRPELRMDLLANAAATRERLLRYLRERAAPHQGQLVMVDLGWGATTQSLIERILRREDESIWTAGLYMVSQSVAAERLLDEVQVDGFLGSAGLPEPLVRSIIRSPEILEQACMPDIGTQLDLDQELEPVLEEPSADLLAQAPARHAVQQGIKAFQREWGRYRVLTPAGIAPLWSGGEELLAAQLARATVAPTGAEARAFSTWRHDENFGSRASDSLVNPGLAKAAHYLGAETLLDLPMSELYWPFGFAALHDDHLAQAAEAVAMNLVRPEAVSSPLESGDFEIAADTGLGYQHGPAVRVRPRRNPRGLSFVRGRLQGESIKWLRLRPAAAPAVIRLDWVRLKLQVRDKEGPVEVTLETREEMRRFNLRGCRVLRPKLLLVDGPRSQLALDLEKEAGGEVYEVEVECAFAALPAAPKRQLPPRVSRQVREGIQGSKRAILRVQERTGLPVVAPLRLVWVRLRDRRGRAATGR